MFDLERRIYRVDRLRLNPNGIPLRGIVYFIAILAAALLASRVPLLGPLVRTLPWYLLDLAAPGASAALLTMIRVEGRPFHLAVMAVARYGAGPRHLAGVLPCPAPGWRWRPGEILLLPDGSDARLRSLRYSGPGAVLVTAAHVRSEHRDGVLRRSLGRPHLVLDALPGRRAPARGRVIALRGGTCLRVRAGTRR